MTKVERHAEICKELNELYSRKNHDYGDSFHRTYLEEGIVALRVHLIEKIDRLKQLSRDPNKQEVLEESIKDTLRDTANYSIMGIMEIDGETYEQ